MSKGKIYSIKVSIAFLVAVASTIFLIMHIIKKTDRQEKISVNVAYAKNDDDPIIINVSGTVGSDQYALISSQAAGIITSVLFQNGQFVKQGTPLFLLENSKDKAALDVASAKQDLSSSTLERYKELYARGIISKQVYQTSLSDDHADAATVEKLKSQLSYKEIVAPFDGFLGERNFYVGDYVQAGQALVSIVNKDQLLIDYQVPETFATQLKLGQRVIVVSDTDPPNSINGVLTFISPAANEETRTITLQAAVNDPAHVLLPKSFVEVYHYIDRTLKPVEIPAESLIVNLNGQYVYKIVGEKAYLVKVIPSIEKGGMIDVYSGLSKGDEVVTAGQSDLSNGAVVKVINQEHKLP